jgi:hypothetical protein
VGETRHTCKVVGKCLEIDNSRQWKGNNKTNVNELGVQLDKSAPGLGSNGVKTAGSDTRNLASSTKYDASVTIIDQKLAVLSLAMKRKLCFSHVLKARNSLHWACWKFLHWNTWRTRSALSVTSSTRTGPATSKNWRSVRCTAMTRVVFARHKLHLRRQPASPRLYVTISGRNGEVADTP